MQSTNKLISLIRRRLDDCDRNDCIYNVENQYLLIVFKYEFTFELSSIDKRVFETNFCKKFSCLENLSQYWKIDTTHNSASLYETKRKDLLLDGDIQNRKSIDRVNDHGSISGSPLDYESARRGTCFASNGNRWKPRNARLIDATFERDNTSGSAATDNFQFRD